MRTYVIIIDCIVRNIQRIADVKSFICLLQMLELGNAQYGEPMSMHCGWQLWDGNDSLGWRDFSQTTLITNVYTVKGE